MHTDLPGTPAKRHKKMFCFNNKLVEQESLPQIGLIFWIITQMVFFMFSTFSKKSHTRSLRLATATFVMATSMLTVPMHSTLSAGNETTQNVPEDNAHRLIQAVGSWTNELSANLDNFKTALQKVGKLDVALQEKLFWSAVPGVLQPVTLTAPSSQLSDHPMVLWPQLLQRTDNTWQWVFNFSINGMHKDKNGFDKPDDKPADGATRNINMAAVLKDCVEKLNGIGDVIVNVQECDEMLCRLLGNTGDYNVFQTSAGDNSSSGAFTAVLASKNLGMQQQSFQNIEGVGVQTLDARSCIHLTSQKLDTHFYSVHRQLSDKIVHDVNARQQDHDAMLKHMMNERTHDNKPVVVTGEWSQWLTDETKKKMEDGNMLYLVNPVAMQLQASKQSFAQNMFLFHTPFRAPQGLLDHCPVDSPQGIENLHKALFSNQTPPMYSKEKVQNFAKTYLEKYPSLKLVISLKAYLSEKGAKNDKQRAFQMKKWACSNEKAVNTLPDDLKELFSDNTDVVTHDQLQALYTHCLSAKTPDAQTQVAETATAAVPPALTSVFKNLETLNTALSPANQKTLTKDEIKKIGQALGGYTNIKAQKGAMDAWIERVTAENLTAIDALQTVFLGFALEKSFQRTNAAGTRYIQVNYDNGCQFNTEGMFCAANEENQAWLKQLFKDSGIGRNKPIWMNQKLQGKLGEWL